MQCPGNGGQQAGQQPKRLPQQAQGQAHDASERIGESMVSPEPAN